MNKESVTYAEFKRRERGCRHCEEIREFRSSKTYSWAAFWVALLCVAFVLATIFAQLKMKFR